MEDAVKFWSEGQMHYGIYCWLRRRRQSSWREAPWQQNQFAYRVHRDEKGESERPWSPGGYQRLGAFFAQYCVVEDVSTTVNPRFPCACNDAWGLREIMCVYRLSIDRAGIATGFRGGPQHVHVPVGEDARYCCSAGAVAHMSKACSGKNVAQPQPSQATAAEAAAESDNVPDGEWKDMGNKRRKTPRISPPPIRRSHNNHNSRSGLRRKSTLNRCPSH